MNIWIDLANSPHVLFFAPIIRELELDGHICMITVRDYAQTIELARQAELNFVTVGRNSNSRLFTKASLLLSRALDLARFIKQRENRVDLAVSFNSYAQIIAAALRRIPSVTIMDYEYQPANHIAFRLARKIIVPTIIPDAALARYGAALSKVNKFNGLKEELYLAGFEPNGRFLYELGAVSSKPLVVLRPPATGAIYHRFENEVFPELLNYLVNQDIFLVILPRSDEQRCLLAPYAAENVIIPSKVLDGKNLSYYADLVISGGGTMNREAAVFGTPVYTFFAGRLGAIDEWLINTGRMGVIADHASFADLPLKKKESAPKAVRNQLLSVLINTIANPV